MEDAHDADEYVEKTDPNGEQKTTADEDGLENVQEHEAGAAHDVRRADDAEDASLHGFVRRRHRRRPRRRRRHRIVMAPGRVEALIVHS